ncbi:hypothetical protein BJ508DRAFT_342598 [Ascobolus immersus RN42]|uniref:HAD-like protein n=1 Tax=Ascobolus immersus RN42 TaxID=1160509 RepID=A0A3N4IPC7_ASCIM|nr:hypothetical protein BJ508DRAFT_342598 [Ascobolus immersus RN42]
MSIRRNIHKYRPKTDPLFQHHKKLREARKNKPHSLPTALKHHRSLHSSNNPVLLNNLSTQSPRMPRQIVNIDLFTLINSAPITETLSVELPDYTSSQIHELATEWRKSQIQYALRLNSMQTYLPFSKIIAASLRATLPSISTKSFNTLTTAYGKLPVYSDVAPFLQKMAELGRKQSTYVHANADPALMKSLVSANAPLVEFFSPDRIVTVEREGCYKPCPRAYAGFLNAPGVANEDSGFDSDTAEVSDEAGRNVVLVSAHPWDVVGAKNCGWRTVLVDRKGEGWTDGVGAELGLSPDEIVRSLEDVPGALQRVGGQ